MPVTSRTVNFYLDFQTSYINNPLALPHTLILYLYNLPHTEFYHYAAYTKLIYEQYSALIHLTHHYS